MRAFYFMYNDGQVQIAMAKTREEAYEILFKYSEFDDFHDFCNSINFVEWLDRKGRRNFHDTTKAEIEIDDKPLLLKNYIILDEVQPEENEI